MIFPADRWLSVLKSWHWFPWRDLTRTLHLTLPAPCWLRSGPREVVPWPQSLAESWGEGSGRRLVPTLGYREGAGCWWLLLLECNAKGHHAYATFVWMLVFSLFCFYLHLLNRTLDLKKIKTVVLENVKEQLHAKEGRLRSSNIHRMEYELNSNCKE